MVRLERWTGDPKVKGLNTVRSTRKTFSFSFSWSNRLCSLAVGVPNPRYIRTHTKDHVRMLKILYCSPCTQSLVDYGNMKITSMHL